MNKGYYGNWTKIDKYKYEVKKERKRKVWSEILRVNREREGRKKKKRKEGKIREKGRDLEEISKKVRFRLFNVYNMLIKL